ncbi:MAG TPA: hypothetical protein VHO06_15830 [Polyangia bacterium]|nr:hypothetical protein [Polyangia bacterium]
MGFWELDVDDIVKAVVAWVPGALFSERRYRDSLLKHLQATFPKNKFHIEFKTGKGKADIFVDFEDRTGFGAKVAIELKYQLKTANECNRLIGQIANYVDCGEVLVVLCDETKQELADAVAKSLQAFCDQKFYRKGRVILKPFAGRAKNGQFTSAQARG